MSDFKLAYQKMTLAEFGGKEQFFLHYHDDEKGYTLGGIYQKANPNAVNWKFIDDIVRLCGDGAVSKTAIKRASKMLYNDDTTQFTVFTYFKTWYWDKIRLDEIHDDKVAQEIYMASVLYGHKRAIKMAQKVAMVLEDGIIGNITLKAINQLDVSYFDSAYDEEELKLAISIASNNNKQHYLKGWKNRAMDSWDIQV